MDRGTLALIKQGDPHPFQVPRIGHLSWHRLTTFSTKMEVSKGLKPLVG